MIQATGWTGSRRLLRLLREQMQAAGSDQQTLDRVVELVAQDFVAEVCSIYLLRAGDLLELFATKGLKPEAVHRTRLQLGEGLIGQIAAQALPLTLADAQKHPNFAYRPETGEDPFHSLLGVPILRGGRALGVLAVQNVTRRTYTEEEIEALETVAMVLAELVAGSNLLGAEEARQVSGAAAPPVHFSGLSLNEGLAMGVAVAHQRGVAIRQVVADDPKREKARFDAAVEAMLAALDELLSRREIARAGEQREVMEAYRMFAADRGWLARIGEAIAGGLTAEAAVERVQNETRARLDQVADGYLRERLVDLEDLGTRLLHHLGQADGAGVRPELPENAVLFARSLGPAELLDYDPRKLAAVVLEEGSFGAHVTIVARALDVPMVGRCRDALIRVRSGDPVVVDGDHGVVLLRPSGSVRDNFAAAMARRAEHSAALAANRNLASVTRDGRSVELLINAGLLIDMPELHNCGAVGIGLYRTEVPFMVRDTYPNLKAQIRLYEQILDQAKGKPVTFRTLDLGGDKRLPYWSGEVEENPALGWRAIRIGLDRPTVLRHQIRSMLRAAGTRPLRVMFPMVTEIAEYERARALVEREFEREQARGHAVPERLQVGAMLEVPSLAWQLPGLLKRVDFLSVGSNDLFQFFFASDRGVPELARRYDSLSPPALSLLRDVARQALAAGKELTLCGEMAGQPIDAMALIGCGFRRLSMAPSRVAGIRSLVRSLEVEPLTAFVERLTELPDHSLRGRLSGYARDHGIAV